MLSYKQNEKNIESIIIVSAGPSLEKNVLELKKAKGKILIVATDAALNTFLHIQDQNFCRYIKEKRYIFNQEE